MRERCFSFIRSGLCGCLPSAALFLFFAGPLFSQSVRSVSAPLNPEFIKQRAARGAAGARAAAGTPALGTVPSPIDRSHDIGKKPSNESKSRAFRPSSYDMRKLGKVSAVKSQGQCGSCWAFAAMSVVESRLLPRREGDFSENNLKDTSGFEYGPCDGGNKDMGTAYLARWSGPVDESADPYSEQGNKRAPEFPSARARRHTQEAFFLPDRSGPKDNDLIKDALAAYGAVWTTIRWEGPSSQSSPQYNAATHAYAYYGGDGSNHGVAIVGWDDNYDRKNFSTVPPGDGAFIVKNSWGEAFGEKGYFYLSYYDSNVTENVVYPDIGDMQEYTGIYQYDPLGNTQSIGYQSDTGFFSNRFTAASDNEKVKAVGFYTTAMNSGYSIAVSVEAGAASAPGVTTVSKKTGVMPYAGYHTVVLDDEVSLSKGQAFFVGVGVTTPGYNFPIPLESAVNGYSAPISEAGQSFISPDGQHWTDVTVDYPNANVCVKAFTVDGGHGPDSR